jgi:hypothetical protein
MLLAPLLAGVMWWETVASTQLLWDAVVGYSSPSQIQWAGCFWSLGFLLVGPTTVLLTTFLTRHRRLTFSERAIRVESLGLLVATPVALLLFLIAAGSAI